jgi:hypothetical protein
MILISALIALSALIGEAQEPAARPAPPPSDTRDLSKYGTVEYPIVQSGAPSKERRLANQRYDGDEWVYKTINNPATGGVGRITEDPPPPSFPTRESDLIIVGEIVAVKAFLSNDLGGVYSEFTIRVDETLKSRESKQPKQVIGDRAGGVVIYPNGQRLLYSSSSLGMPLLGASYLFFLAKSGDSPNYEIVTAYDLSGTVVRRVDQGDMPEVFLNKDKPRFLEIARERIARSDKTTSVLSDPQFGQIAIVDYEAEETLSPSELHRRKAANARYDGEDWVYKKTSPETGMVGRIDELEPPPIFPTAESDIIVIGRVTHVSAHLSNDKSGVYSEFKIAVTEVLKNNGSILGRDWMITTDRAGGVVRYPNGQAVIYRAGQYGLPQVGSEYLLFLRHDWKEPNCRIITLYQLRDTHTVTLDTGRRLDEVKQMGKSALLKAVREKLSASPPRSPQ